MPPRVTRLAPSPTGALHLGNARTFLINWALAKHNKWKIVLRIEDLDTPRVKADAQRQAIEDLTWLGMDWDEGPHYQVNDLAAYWDAIVRLFQNDLVYGCTCSRSEIAAASASALSAPNQGDVEPRYPGTCRSELEGVGSLGYERNPTLFNTRAWDYLDKVRRDGDVRDKSSCALRVVIPDEPTSFADMIAGPQSINVQQQVGDFLVATKAMLPAYQLAVVVDDARQGITDIVRGDDLIPSTGRQLWLYRHLNITPLPNYWHVPLVVGEDGRRLAKRHGDTRLSWYREQGVSADRIIGLIARWSGITGPLAAMSAKEFAAKFQVKKLPLEPVVFSAKDHEWLLEK